LVGSFLSLINRVIEDEGFPRTALALEPAKPIDNVAAPRIHAITGKLADEVRELLKREPE